LTGRLAYHGVRTETKGSTVNRIDLEGKRAVVTGSGQGIGRAIAERLLASGAAVALWERDRPLVEATQDELASRGKVLALAVDVTDLAAVEAAARKTSEGLGGIDILVNNAGIAGPNHPLWEYPPDAWREVVEIDLNAVFYCCRAVVPQMIERNYGRICNVASIAGKEGNPSASAYAAAKAGVIALTKALGKELASHDIAVNCITPAAARTRIFDQITQEFVEYMLAKIPRGRFVKVEEIAAMVAWLVSQENSFTTGAVFDLSGGRATY
jgi:2-dehydro-3-deoxy-L-rhamnonate dehydrogenase (NAD+)